MKHYKTVLSLALTGALLSTQALASGLPTVDGANLAQAVLDYVQKGEQHIEDLEKFQSQIDELGNLQDLTQDLFNESFLKSRGFGDFMTFETVEDFLEGAGLVDGKTLNEVLGEIATTEGVPEVKGEVGEEYKKRGYDEICNAYNQGKGSTQAYERCVKSGMVSSAISVSTKKAVDKGEETYQRLSDLTQKIHDTQNPKEIAELQAAIAREQAMIQQQTNVLLGYYLQTVAEQQHQVKLEEKAVKNYLSPSQNAFDIFKAK